MNTPPSEIELKAEMDWLETNPVTIVHFKPSDDGNKVRIYCDDGMFYGQSVREAIRNAMKATALKQTLEV